MELHDASGLFHVVFQVQLCCCIYQHLASFEAKYPLLWVLIHRLWAFRLLQLWGALTGAVMSSSVSFSAHRKALISLVCMPKMQLLNPMATLCLHILEINNLSLRRSCTTSCSHQQHLVSFQMFGMFQNTFLKYKHLPA